MGLSLECAIRTTGIRFGRLVSNSFWFACRKRERRGRTEYWANRILVRDGAVNAVHRSAQTIVPRFLLGASSVATASAGLSDAPHEKLRRAGPRHDHKRLFIQVLQRIKHRSYVGLHCRSSFRAFACEASKAQHACNKSRIQRAHPPNYLDNFSKACWSSWKEGCWANGCRSGSPTANRFQSSAGLANAAFRNRSRALPANDPSLDANWA